MQISDCLEISLSFIKGRKREWALSSFLILLLVFHGYAKATPDCPIVTGGFQGLANGTTVNTSATGWSVDASGVPSTAVYFAVKSNRFHAEDLGGIGIWKSNVFSVTGYSSFQVAVKVSSEGDQNSTEYAKIYYKINGGSEILLDERTGNFGTIDFISPELTGSNVQIIVKLYNYNNGGSQTSKYYVEEYRVFKQAGPCAGSISVSASADRTVLTCSNSSATLSASSSASGVTYSWSGPNSFSSTSQNPVVSSAGTYTVTGTSSGGTGTASVTLTENKTAPGVTAAGGSLGCASTVTLTASSSASGVTYSWTGPSFSSTSQNPAVSVAGTYTVTVTDPANGCTSQQSVSVTTSGSTTNFWLEDFVLNNGTTTDTGTTSWSIQNTSSGTFSVNSNEFKVSGIGTSTQGIWTSGVIDISGKTNVAIAVETRSSGVVMNSSGTYMDYLRIYYKLNGSSTETLLSEQLGSINSHSTTNTTVSVGSLSGTSLQIIVKARASGSDEFYYFDNVKITGTSQSVTATASVSSTLTCSTTSVTLTGGSNASGVTYSWTGPNSFTSSSQNPAVSAPGLYTLTVANSSGCSGTASVTVSQNNAAPGATASVSGSLSCGSSVTLNGSSGTSGVAYGWTGPNSFTSTAQNPVVTTAGTYILTVTNPANGCTSTQSIQVTSAATTSTLWLEDFALSNGATSDTGATPWSVTNTSSGTFSVNSSEFKIFGIGTSTQGVWTSGTIDITNKANVNISVGVRSSGVTMNTSGTYLDFLRIYYKLNGGSEVLFSEHIGNINSHSTTNTTVSIGSLNGTSLQIIVKARATGTDEFYYFDNVKASGTAISTSFTVSIPTPGAITCAAPSVTLTANGSVSGLSYSWTGPDGFTSVQQNPVVSAAGQYTVTASQGGCAATASVTVSENKTAPQLTASGATLTCATSATLAASSTVSGVIYSWTGPGGFTSTQSNPVVSTPGTYSITITDPVNGCTNAQSVTVTTSTGSGTATDFWVEDFTFGNGTIVDNGTTSWSLQNAAGIFSVQNSEFKAAFPSANEGVWLSGVVDISAKSDVVISALLKSGTTSTSDYLEEDDYFRVFYKLNGGTETLAYENYGGFNNNNNTSQSYSYTSATPLNGSTLQVVIRVRNSHSTEQYYFDNIKLNGMNSPLGVINTSVSGSISCTNTSVQLSASSTVSSATYYWVRPDGTTINQQNPTVSVPGNYVVVVSANGCQATQTVTVSGSQIPPDVSIIGNNFSCSGGASTVNLTAYSSVSGVTHSWSGPGTITNGTTATAIVTTGGTYTVTTTNPANACTSTASFTVGYTDGSTTTVWNETFDELGDGTTSENGATAWTVDNSKIHTVSLSSYSDETGTPYYQEVRSGNLTAKTTRGEVVWTSQSISISAHNQVQLKVDVTGEGSLNDETDCGSDCYDYDYVKISYKLNDGPEIPFSTNGAFAGKLALNGLMASTGILSGSTVQIVIRSYNTGNNEMFHYDNIRVLKIESGTATVSTSVSGPLTCTSNTATLTATPVVSGATYSWAGPESTTHTGASVNVSVAGTYNLTVSGSGGCLSGAAASVTVLENKTAPVVTVSTPDVLTCNRTSLTLAAVSSPSSGVNYLWTRPDGSTLSSTGLTVTQPGAYVIRVTNPVNECYGETTVNVYQNDTPPDIMASPNGSITCFGNSVDLEGYSATEGVTYSWTGPGTITNPTSATATVNTAGTYTLTVTNPTTGCVSVENVNVDLNTNLPGAGASVSGPITCTSTTVTLTGTSGSLGVTYAWTGPGAITNPTSATATVTTAGTYTLTVTNPSTGCVSTAIANVVLNNTLPGASASVSGQLDCNTSVVTLTGSSGTSGVTYSWSGPGTITNPTLASPTVTTAGTYTVVVTNIATGCQSTASATVTENTTLPGAKASVTGQITCAPTSFATLTATSGTTTGVMYAWSGPGTISNPALASPTVTTAGTYTVIVTNSATGCQSTASVTVTENKTTPGAAASVIGVFTCVVNTVTLTASSSTTGVTYSWSGPGFSSAQQNPPTSTGGTYTVTVTSQANGCTSSASATTQENKTPPGVTPAATPVITCNLPSITLGATSVAGAIYTWSGPSGFSSNEASPSTSLGGSYSVTARDQANGCTSTANFSVQENKTLPENVSAAIAEPGILNCNNTVVTLNGSTATSGVTYSWTGPENYASTVQNPTTNIPGIYVLTIKSDANGCQATDDVTVERDNTKPEGVTAIVNNVIDCANPAATITGGSTTSDVIYSWTGPGTFTSSAASFTVSTGGTYTLTVTNPANGCSALPVSVTVTKDTNTPGISIGSPDGTTLTCFINPVRLNGSSGTAGVTYSWTNLAGLNTNLQNIQVTTPGDYVLTVTAPNGCTNSATKTVDQNLSAITATAGVSSVVSCRNPSVSLNGGTSGTPVMFSRTGPSDFISSQEDPTNITVPGPYTLTIASAGGCTDTKTITVEEDRTEPQGVTADYSGSLGCGGFVILEAYADTPGVTYRWEGPGDLDSNNPETVVNLPGTYTLTATHPDSGCQVIKTVTITDPGC